MAVGAPVLGALERRLALRPPPGARVAQRHHVVHVQPHAERAVAARALERRHEERQRLHEMRREPHHQLALDQRLAHEPEVEVLQVAQPAVDHLRRAARGPARPVVALHERDREPARRGVQRDPGAGDAAADHDQVEGLALQRGLSACVSVSSRPGNCRASAAPRSTTRGPQSSGCRVGLKARVAARTGGTSRLKRRSRHDRESGRPVPMAADVVSRQARHGALSAQSRADAATRRAASQPPAAPPAPAPRAGGRDHRRAASRRPPRRLGRAATGRVADGEARGGPRRDLVRRACRALPQLAALPATRSVRRAAGCLTRGRHRARGARRPPRPRAAPAPQRERLAAQRGHDLRRHPDRRLGARARVAEAAVVLLQRGAGRRAASARRAGSDAGAAPAATMPCTAQAVDWALER